MSCLFVHCVYYLLQLKRFVHYFLQFKKLAIRYICGHPLCIRLATIVKYWYCRIGAVAFMTLLCRRRFGRTRPQKFKNGWLGTDGAAAEAPDGVIDGATDGNTEGWVGAVGSPTRDLWLMGLLPGSYLGQQFQTL